MIISDRKNKANKEKNTEAKLFLESPDNSLKGVLRK